MNLKLALFLYITQLAMGGRRALLAVLLAGTVLVGVDCQNGIGTEVELLGWERARMRIHTEKRGM